HLDARLLRRVLQLDPISDVRSECLEKHGNAVTAPNVLRDARLTVEPSVLPQCCVFVDHIERKSLEQFLVERALESMGVVLGDVAGLSSFCDEALILGGCDCR